jgi:Aldehyde dehydrogenase family
VLAGGGRFGDRGYFVEPAVLTNTRPEMKVVREEIFGPVLVAAPFTDLDEIAPALTDDQVATPLPVLATSVLAEQHPAEQSGFGEGLPRLGLAWPPPHSQGTQEKGAEEHDNSDDQQVKQALGDDTHDAEHDRHDHEEEEESQHLMLR